GLDAVDRQRADSGPAGELGLTHHRALTQLADVVGVRPRLRTRASAALARTIDRCARRLDVLCGLGSRVGCARPSLAALVGFRIHAFEARTLSAPDGGPSTRTDRLSDT